MVGEEGRGSARGEPHYGFFVLFLTMWKSWGIRFLFGLLGDDDILAICGRT